MKKRVSYFLSISISLVILFITAGSFYLLSYALYNGDRNKTSRYQELFSSYPELKPWLDSLTREKILRDTFISMPTGERAHAVFAASPSSNGHTALLVHGYHDTHADMLPIAYIYNQKMNYNILLPDLHGHGLSDGDDVQMGWKDRKDILHWLSLIPRIFPSPTDSLRTVVHGISMGAATTMYTSGEPTPAFVKCFVEDCGYTSVWDEFGHELRKRFSLPEFPLLYTADWLCLAKYGWSFKRASAIRQIEKSSKPMLFIHGSDDTFVPTYMVYKLYKAKPRPKELWIAPGSKHACSYKDHKQEYAKRIIRFAEKWNR